MSNLFQKTDERLIGVFMRAMGLVMMGLSSRKIAIGSPTWEDRFGTRLVVKHLRVELCEPGETPGEKLGDISMLIDARVWERMMGPLEADEKELSKPNPVWGTEARAKLAHLRGDVYTQVDALKELGSKDPEVIEALELAIKVSAAPTEEFDRLDFVKEALSTLSMDEKLEAFDGFFAAEEYVDRARALMKMLTDEEREALIADINKED